MTETIFHIARRSDWRLAQKAGEYRADSLVSEGFIHCSTIEQVLRVANDLYASRHGLVLLSIDTAKLISPVKWEIPPTCAESFPHIYGPINLEAVIKAPAFEPDPDGKWRQIPS